MVQKFWDKLEEVRVDLSEKLSMYIAGESLCVVLTKPRQDTYRKSLGSFYKAQREDPPENVMTLYEALKDLPNIVNTPEGIEGDDYVGILGDSTDYCVRVGIDKDLLTLPGWNYNPDKESLTYVSLPQANWNWVYQALVGDSCDGYKGIPRVGPVKAKKILGEPEQSFRGLYERALEFCVEKGVPEEYLKEQLILSHILRPGELASDWLYDKQMEDGRDVLQITIYEIAWQGTFTTPCQ